MDGSLARARPSSEAAALDESLRALSDCEKQRCKRGCGYPWSALKNTHINREAAEAAGRVGERLGSEVVNFGSSGFCGNVQTLVGWTRDLIFFNANACDRRVGRLVTAAWTPKVRSLAIRVTPQAGDETEPDAIVKIVHRLPNLREIYLVVSYHDLVDDDSASESDIDYGSKAGFGDGGEAVRKRSDLCWGYLFTVGALAGILSRRASGYIASPQDDFMQDLRPDLMIAEEIPFAEDSGVGSLEEHTAEDVNEALVFFERNWVARLSKSLNGSGQEVKVKWVL